MEDHYKHPEEKKVKFRLNLLSSNRENIKWVIIITVVSFFLSAFMSFASSQILEDVNNLIAFCVVLIIILIGIVFDMIGIAVTAADEAPFHAMASRKVYGARQAIKLIRNANKVSSFCNDVVGDISGVISGAASAIIALKISQNLTVTQAAVTALVISGMVASTTIGGKAAGKTVAIQNSNYIVYKVAVIIKFLTVRLNQPKGRTSYSKQKQKKKLKG